MKGGIEMPEFKFVVDDEYLTTSEHTLTPAQILVLAKLDPGNYYLILVHGEKQTSFQDNPEEKIHMHQNMKFISVFLGDTPVS